MSPRLLLNEFAAVFSLLVYFLIKPKPSPTYKRPNFACFPGEPIMLRCGCEPKFLDPKLSVKFSSIHSNHKDSLTFTGDFTSVLEFQVDAVELLKEEISFKKTKSSGGRQTGRSLILRVESSLTKGLL